MHFISITLFLFIIAGVQGSFLSLFGNNRLNLIDQNTDDLKDEQPKLIKKQSKKEKKQSKDLEDLVRLSKQDDIKIESLQKYTTQFDFEMPCDIKKGYLLEIFDQDKTSGQLMARPVFAVMNTATFTIFKDQSILSMEKAFNIQSVHIETLNTPVQKLYCFFVSQDKQTSGVDQRISLCSPQQSVSLGWVRGFASFNQCCKNNGEDEMLNDPQYEKVKKDIIQKAREIESKHMWKEDDFIQDFVHDDMKKLREQEDKEVAHLFEQFKNDIQEKEAKEKLLKRKIVTQIEMVNKKKKEMMTKKECIEREIDQKILEQKDKMEMEIEKEISRKIKTLMLTTLAKSEKAKEVEKDKITDIYEYILVDRKKEEQALEEKLTEEVVEATDEKPDVTCYDELLKTAKRIDYIKAACLNLFPDDEQEQAVCSLEENFAKMCCREKIGKTHLQDLVECEEKTEKILNKGMWVYVPYKATDVYGEEEEEGEECEEQ